MLVKTVIQNGPKPVITAKPETTIDQAMELLIQNNIGCLPVVEGSGRLVGIVTDKDIFKKIHETSGDYHKFRVCDLMKTDLIVGLPEDDLDYIAGLMSNNWIRHVPIVDQDRVIGLISSRDIIKADHTRTKIENRYLKLYLEGLGTRDHSSED